MDTFNSKQELQQFMGLDSWRNLSSAKVLELVRLISRGQLSEAAKAQVIEAVPGLLQFLSQPAVELNGKLIESNDRSFDSVGETIRETQRLRCLIAANPDMTSEDKEKVYEELSKGENKEIERDQRKQESNRKISEYVLEGAKYLGVIVVGGIVLVASKGGAK